MPSIHTPTFVYLSFLLTLYLCFRLMLIFQVVSIGGCIHWVYGLHDAQGFTLVSIFHLCLALMALWGVSIAYHAWTQGLRVDAALVGLMVIWLGVWEWGLQRLDFHMEFERGNISFEDYRARWVGEFHEPFQFDGPIDCASPDPLRPHGFKGDLPSGA